MLLVLWVMVLGWTGRVADLGLELDHELGRLLETLGDTDYTVMVFSDPNEFKAYEPEFAAPVHMDMRRWAEKPEPSDGSKSNSTANLPLFEKYQFFTPGKSSPWLCRGDPTC